MTKKLVKEKKREISVEEISNSRYLVSTKTELQKHKGRGDQPKEMICSLFWPAVMMVC